MRRPGIRRYGSVLPALALLAFACAVESGGQRLDAAGMQREISRAFAERDPLEQRLRLAELMRELNPENVSGAAEVFIEVPSYEVSPDAATTFMYAWSRFDPQAALDHAVRYPGSTRRARMGGAVVYYWASQGDSREAARALHAQGDGKVLAVGQRDLVAGWAAGADLDGLADYLADVRGEEARGNLTRWALINLLQKKGQEAAIRWTVDIPGDSPAAMKATAFGKLMTVLVGIDPQIAASLYDEHASQDYAQDAMKHIAADWAGMKGDAAFEWIVTKPPSAARDEAVHAAAERWLTADPEAAVAWLTEAVEEQEALAPAYYPLAIHISIAEPKLGLTLSERIPNSVLRGVALKYAFLRWRTNEPQAAEDWYASVELPDELRASIDRGRVIKPRRRRAVAGQGEK